MHIIYQYEWVVELYILCNQNYIPYTLCVHWLTVFLKQHRDWPFSFLLWSPVNQMLQIQDKTGTSTSSVCS